jgi:stage V sporulation protein D (sporulation-specific penicillin-binding protein)
MQVQINKNWIRVAALFFFLICVFLLFKLYNLQVLKHEEYRDISNRQNINKTTVVNDREPIILRYKDGKELFAAIDKKVYKVFINPKVIKNPEDTFNLLSEITEIDENDFFEKISNKNSNSQLLSKNFENEESEKIKALKLQGVFVESENKRFYPGKELAAQTIGFVSYKGDKLVGTYGLESLYDEVLRKDRENSLKNFFVQIFSGSSNSIINSKNSGSIELTIEPNVQTFAEEVIKDLNQKWNPKKTGIIIMNPKNGEIYAIAQAPSFDLNNFNEQKDVSIFNNDVVSSIYQMGSIIKPLTIAIGIEEGKITPTSTYEDKGSLTLNGETFYNHDKKAHGVVDMQEVINKSLNLGVTHVALLVGEAKFRDYIKKMFDDKTGIDLPGELSPKISNLDSLRSIEIASASFGQGIALTPISTIRSLASLANGGYLVHPHLVKSIKYEMGKSKDLEVYEKKKIFKEETVRQTTNMLVKAVDEALLGGKISMENYSIAAKTGTAQIASGGKYLEDSYFHSFIGYFPAYNPEFIILMYTVEPKGVLYSSDTLTLPFSDIVKYLINYYNIEPDRQNETIN